MIEDALIIAILQIIAIDIVLGGDNAIIIALACRNLPARQKRLGVLWGTAGAIILRCILVFFASTLLTVPSLKLIGGLLLIWIGVKLLAEEEVSLIPEDDRRGREREPERVGDEDEHDDGRMLWLLGGRRIVSYASLACL